MSFEAVARSMGRLRIEGAYHSASVHDIRRIESGLDAPHRCDAAGVSVLLKKMPLEATDAMLSAERAPRAAAASYSRRDRLASMSRVNAIRSVPRGTRTL